ncbi:MAG: hypothetical protein IJW70_11295 [Clostridia bacterium]|nr:hypothetical protein [Clostridia bacterium]
MLFHLADFIIDVDVERTRAFYERSDVPTTSEGCTCSGCQNFDKAILTVPNTVTDFLHSLGIDPRKPVEVFDVTGEREADGTIWYNGWYHVCGEVVRWPNFERTENRISISAKDCYQPDRAFRFEVIAVPMTDLAHKQMPTPIIELDFDTHLPYVLQESR